MNEPGHHPPSSRRSSSPARAITWAALIGFLTASGAATAYFQTYGGRKPFDDEGLFISWLRGFMEGHVLYDEVHSIFGPAYYLYQWSASFLVGRATDYCRSHPPGLHFFWLRRQLITLCPRMENTHSWVLARELPILLVFSKLFHFYGEELAHRRNSVCCLARCSRCRRRCRLAQGNPVDTLWRPGRHFDLHEDQCRGSDGARPRPRAGFFHASKCLSEGSQNSLRAWRALFSSAAPAAQSGDALGAAPLDRGVVFPGGGARNYVAVKL